MEEYGMGIWGAERVQSLALGGTEGKVSAAETRGLTEPPSPFPACQEAEKEARSAPSYLSVRGLLHLSLDLAITCPD